MEKMVNLVLKSPLCEETIEVPAEVWERFEKKATELEIAVEELFQMLLERFIKDPNLVTKVKQYIEDVEI